MCVHGCAHPNRSEIWRVHHVPLPQSPMGEVVMDYLHSKVKWSKEKHSVLLSKKYVAMVVWCPWGHCVALPETPMMVSWVMGYGLFVSKRKGRTGLCLCVHNHGVPEWEGFTLYLSHKHPLYVFKKKGYTATLQLEYHLGKSFHQKMTPKGDFLFYEFLPRLSELTHQKLIQR